MPSGTSPKVEAKEQPKADAKVSGKAPRRTSKGIVAVVANGATRRMSADR